ncbi:Ste ste11 protein kinase [Mycena kentingensis (nom. inval.)]|nr:Ste ste11 protein kinase [Mycena kentingensis (nom. inval.)]
MPPIGGSPSGTSPSASRDFCRRFWGANDEGVAVLLAKAEDGMQSMHDLQDFWNERFVPSQNLVSPLQRRLQSDDRGALRFQFAEVGGEDCRETQARASLIALALETRAQGVSHEELASQIRNDIEQQTTDFIDRLTHEYSLYHTPLDNQLKSKQLAEEAAARARRRYENSSVMFRNQQIVELSQSMTALREATARWQDLWKEFCDYMQSREEDRMEFLKDIVWFYANAVSTVCVAVDDSCEKIRVALDAFEPNDDVAAFADSHGTSDLIHQPMAWRWPRLNESDGPTVEWEVLVPAHHVRGTTRPGVPANTRTSVRMTPPGAATFDPELISLNWKTLEHSRSLVYEMRSKQSGLARQRAREMKEQLGDAVELAAAQQRVLTIEQQLVSQLQSLVRSISAQAVVLALRGDQAQRFLNTAQQILTLDFPDSLKHRTQCLLLKLATRSEQLPTTLFITDIRELTNHALFGGAFGDVYRGMHGEQTVAVKRMRMFLDEGIPAKKWKKICREALVWQNLQHDFILPFLGVDVTTFSPAISLVSPWMKHGTILKYLHTQGRAHIEQFIIEIAEGVAYLHASKIVHGDLRGANILISDDHHALISDFGLASVISDQGEDAWVGVPTTSTHAGNVRWWPPELCLPSEFGFDRFERTPAADAWAFGCVCYEARVATGNIPFHQLQEMETMRAVLDGRRPERPPGVQYFIWEVMQLVWAEKAVDRPRMRNVATRLRAGLKQGTTPRQTSPERPETQSGDGVAE